MIKFTIISMFLLLGLTTFAQRPGLTLTAEGVDKIKNGLDTAPLFDKELKHVQKEVDKSIKAGIKVPIPKDMAGGYTHSQHTRNYKLMHKAGNLYQITGEDKYADFVKEMLLEYSKIYKTLPLHPTMKSYATGKIFWQCLNDANWLVATSQAYDCIYDYLSKKEIKQLEADLFIPFANFLSIENPRFFNRIHNHSTWANAAVGLIALAMDNDTLLQKALYGLNYNDGINTNEIDNDGGFIKKEGVEKAGFLAQLDYSFSPEGYFSEGPYYQRYAIFPFLVFSHALHNKKPELNIFEYRDGILKKATNTLLLLTDPQGNYFPINDSQKGMNYKAYEVVTAVDLMYMVDPSHTNLLGYAALQDKVAFNEAGFIVAKKLATSTPSIPVKKSQLFSDGVNGDEGGIAVLRSGETEMLFKFSAQGMGHGHFDRLSYSLYDQSGEVVQDYGAVRWVNVEQKGGGRYLPENKTFGKQTIAHNTIVVNQNSQYDASVKKAEKQAPTLYFADLNSDWGVQAISAIENNAYKGTNQQRTLLLYEDPAFMEPLIIDLFIVNSQENTTYDLPLWFMGHQMKSSFDCEKQLNSMTPIGTNNGYQHIWQESNCTMTDNHFSFNWFGNKRFYTQSSYCEKGDEVMLGRAGANDPNYNLRSDPVLIHRKNKSGNTVFFNIIESHGKYSTTTEIPNNPYNQIETVEVIHCDEDYAICSFTNLDSKWEIYFSRTDNNSNSSHKVEVLDQTYQWKGIYNITKSNI